MVTWMAGSFTCRACSSTTRRRRPDLHRRFKIMERKVFWGIATPGGGADDRLRPVALARLVPGAGLWLHAKLALVGGARRLSRLVRQADDGFPARAQHARPRWYGAGSNEFPCWFFVAIVLLVVLQAGQGSTSLATAAARP
jgi:putative membrane protein